MDALRLARETHCRQLEQARQRYFVAGISPDGDLLRAPILRSWQRCRALGLSADQPPPDRACLDPHPLQELREGSRQLLGHGRAVIDLVHEQIREAGSLVSLSNADGLLLESMGDAKLAEQVAALGLLPGACWQEGQRGTNAIGTALADDAMTQVLGGEHFFARHAALAGSAAPVRGPDGTVLGVVSIVNIYQGDEPHTRGLVGLAAALIESRLFAVAHAGDILLGLRGRGGNLGSPQDGLLAVSPEGRLRAINQAALEILGRRRPEVVDCDFDRVFDYRFALLIDRLRSEPAGSHELSVGGTTLWLQARGPLPSGRRYPAAPEAVRGQSRPLPASAGITLDTLDSGDPRVRVAIARVRRILGRDIPLLIQGESGVGKEMLAKGFHNSGPRRAAPFVALNCAAIPENLIESELFGYAGGAYTGARKEGAPGKIQQAHGGTLFLDEIGDMPLALQSRLLRVLQERCVTPLGTSHSIPVDLSVVCASHRCLREEVAQGNFREDLYYRLNSLSITLPPLRERGDIRLLIAQLAAQECRGRRAVHFADEALQIMETYRWPGNLRQLFNVIQVTIALLDDNETLITPQHLPEELLEARPAAPTAPEFVYRLDEIGSQATRRALETAGGNISAAARQLGISRNTLYRKLHKLDARPEDQPAALKAINW